MLFYEIDQLNVRDFVDCYRLLSSKSYVNHKTDINESCVVYCVTKEQSGWHSISHSFCLHSVYGKSCWSSAGSNDSSYIRLHIRCASDKGWVRVASADNAARVHIALISAVIEASDWRFSSRQWRLISGVRILIEADARCLVHVESTHVVSVARNSSLYSRASPPSH